MAGYVAHLVYDLNRLASHLYSGLTLWNSEIYFLSNSTLERFFCHSFHFIQATNSVIDNIKYEGLSVKLFPYKKPSRIAI